MQIICKAGRGGQHLFFCWAGHKQWNCVQGAALHPDPGQLLPQTCSKLCSHPDFRRLKGSGRVCLHSVPLWVTSSFSSTHGCSPQPCALSTALAGQVIRNAGGQRNTKDKPMFAPLAWDALCASSNNRASGCVTGALNNHHQQFELLMGFPGPRKASNPHGPAEAPPASARTQTTADLLPGPWDFMFKVVGSS